MSSITRHYNLLPKWKYVNWGRDVPELSFDWMLDSAFCFPLATFHDYWGSSCWLKYKACNQYTNSCLTLFMVLHVTWWDQTLQLMLRTILPTETQCEMVLSIQQTTKDLPVWYFDRKQRKESKNLKQSSWDVEVKGYYEQAWLTDAECIWTMQSGTRFAFHHFTQHQKLVILSKGTDGITNLLGLTVTW